MIKYDIPYDNFINNELTLLICVRFLQLGSDQTKEASAKTFRQLCVEESARGLMVQQGGLKACCAAAVDDNNYSVSFFYFHIYCYFVYSTLFPKETVSHGMCSCSGEDIGDY